MSGKRIPLKLSKKILFILLFILLCTYAPFAAAADTYPFVTKGGSGGTGDETPRLMVFDACSNPLQISFSESNYRLPYSPDAYDNQVVFVENENIYLLDLPMRFIRELTVDGGNSEPAISDSGVVWVHSYTSNFLTSQNTTSQIYYYNPNTGETRQITSGDANRRHPAVSENKIVWIDSRNGNQDIYLYDIISRSETQITANPADQDAPAIFDNWVVWRDGRDGLNKTIYIYNLSNKEFSRISSTGDKDTGAPEITGTKVAWAGNRSILYLYDILTKVESSLAVDISEDGGVSVSRNQIVWHDPSWRSPPRTCPLNMFCPVETCCPPEYQVIMMYFFSDNSQEVVYLRQTSSGNPAIPVLDKVDLRPKVSDSLLIWVSEKIAVCSLSNQNISSLNLRRIPYSHQLPDSSLTHSQSKIDSKTQWPATPLSPNITFIAIGVGIGLYMNIIWRKGKI
jgi:beta propeller repeat protein